MKYKVGDKVRVKSLEWYNANKDLNGVIWGEGNISFGRPKLVYCGKEVTIDNINGNYYYIKEAKEYSFADWMFEDKTTSNVIDKDAFDQYRDSYIKEQKNEADVDINNNNNNSVNHPKHYNMGNIECIDAMESAYGIEAVMAFCKCNAFKYIWRFDNKNGDEDILKAQFYQNKYLELQDKLKNK